ncbi:MAG: glutamate--tRNA ligase [Deltaproteobacteria bacterium HGW-Deltaproteobacteria-19]|jgi:glutamyl-tRNA synthetase|nr:MAG: glutamate--tRNA ligase [Deltaproteobacteria bacterium HGW-Deltaproteobacteria-19]
MNTPIKTRFAPSPTGYLHIGGARTALFNWLFARRHGGIFLLRIEDTDQIRSTEESTQAILDAMTWLGLTWDEGPFFQAERVGIHRQMVEKLVDEGKAYWCTCTQDELEAKRKTALAEGRKPKYDGTCRERHLSPTPGAVVRFRCPDGGTTRMQDLIKGNILFQNEELDDLIIQRADGYPTYNFAVVIDDAQMGITHVIRGDDHVNNTPRQILLYEALGFPVPFFAHVPMILGSDKARLSKRHGATSVMAYRDMGYLPEALVNYLVRLGWSHGDQEIFTGDELTSLFDLDAVGKSPAVFNPEKLLWLNQHYIRSYPADRLMEALQPLWPAASEPSQEALVRGVARDLQSRSRTLLELIDGAAFYFADEVAYDPKAAEKFLTQVSAVLLEAVLEGLPHLMDYSKEGIEAFLRALAESRQAKLKDIAQPLRVALTGKTVSPGIDEVMVTLGRERTLDRISRALSFLRSTSSA